MRIGVPVLSAVLGAALLAGCAAERPQLRGQGCDLNTDCEEPLVCGLGRCRRECRTYRDCAAALDCILLPSGLGVCQLEDELDCDVDEDCREKCGGNPDCQELLACRDNRCGRVCLTDRDCPPDATCEAGDDGVRGCEVPERELCIYNSDCPEPYVCDHDQVCRFECRETVDCDYPRVCVGNLCELPDGGV